MTTSRTRPHPVLELLRRRTDAGSRPGNRRDGAKLGLAIEGGCMRGVVSGGMLIALEKLGLLDAFDTVYGSSAGAVNGAYFLAGQALFGSPIYLEHINDQRFISLGRSFTRRPVISLSYLLDEVMTRRVVLDWRRVLESPIPFKIAATSVAEPGLRLLHGFRDRRHLFAALRASSSIPLLAGPPAEVDGEPFLDALLYEPIPYRTALADGCTHLLVLLTRPEGNLNGKTTLFERYVLGRWIADLEPRLREAYLAQDADYDRRVRRLRAATAEASGPPYVYALHSPRTAPPIRWLEKDAALLKRAGDAGRKAVLAALWEQDLPAPPLLSAGV